MVKVIINRDKCKGCLLCISVCPKKALIMDKNLNRRGIKPIVFNKHSVCAGCGMCVVICPDAVIEVHV